MLGACVATMEVDLSTIGKLVQKVSAVDALRGQVAPQGGGCDCEGRQVGGRLKRRDLMEVIMQVLKLVSKRLKREMLGAKMITVVDDKAFGRKGQGASAVTSTCL